MCVNDEHLKNARIPILVIDDGISIDKSDVHSANEQLPIDVTDSGIDIFLSFEQPLKLSSASDVIVFGIESFK